MDFSVGVALRTQDFRLGCAKVERLPLRYGNWHTIYTRMNRWSKNGVLDRVFEHLQREQIVPILSAVGGTWSIMLCGGTDPLQIPRPLRSPDEESWRCSCYVHLNLAAVLVSAVADN